MRARPTARRFGAIAAVAVLAVVLTGCDDTSTTTVASVNYDCQINPNNFLLPPFSDSLTVDYSTNAPQAVAPGGQAVVTLVPPPFTLDGTPNSGGTVTQLTNMVYKVTIPANGTVANHAIADWANVGAGTPTATRSGNVVTVTVPGPILANVTATLPTVYLQVTATGALGSRIQPRIAGTSYASPGLTFTTKVTGTLLGTLNPTFACFPSPSTNLHSILISNDTAPPEITIASPIADQTVVRNSSLIADFSCNDGTGVGVASCVGTVADGAAINTSTVGAKTFTVTATDNEGKVSTATVNYTVVNP